MARMTGLMVLLACVTAVAAEPHPYLADVPENRAWLAPSGTGHVQNVNALDPGQPAAVVLRRDKVLGGALPIAVATDAQMLMLVEGDHKLLFKLSGRVGSPQMLELCGRPAEVRLDDKVVADPGGAWPKMMHASGGQTLTLRFVGATKVKLEFDADAGEPQETASFFGISADPSDPAYQRIARQRKTAAAARSRPAAEPRSEPTVDLSVHREEVVAPPPPPAPKYATDFLEVATTDLVAKVQPATVWVEARIPRPGVTAVTHGFFVSEDGMAVVSLDAIAEATELRVTYAPADAAETTTNVADLLMHDASKGLALIKVRLAEGAKVQPLQLAALRPGEGVKLWVVEAQGASEPSYGECQAGSTPRNDDDPWVNVRGALRTTDAGAVIVNPLGEAVAIASWQSASEQHYHALSVEAVATMMNDRPATPPALSELRALRAEGALPGHAPASLRIDNPQPASALQRDAIGLKDNYVCRVCKGKGEVAKKVHKAMPGNNSGAGKEWYEMSMISCPTCKGGKLAPSAALTRLLEGIAETMAMGDTADPKWDAARDFAAQTLGEVVSTSPRELHRGLVDGIRGFDPAKLRLGQSVLMVGRVETLREPGVLVAPDCAFIKPAEGTGVVMVGLRLNRGGTGTVLASGLYAGTVRMADGTVAPVLQNGLTLSLPDAADGDGAAVN